MDFLQKFRDVQAALKSQTPADCKELDALRAENEKLKTTVAKQEYRIRHMKTHLEELLDATKSSTAAA